MEPAFLAAIHAEPHSDTPRLVFADWLDERGHPGDAERVEFIRLGVAEPGRTFWKDTKPTDRASEIAAACWNTWTKGHRTRLAASPFARWIEQGDCHWGYRRGFVTAFDSNERVLLDAWTDFFQLGPVEEVSTDVSYFRTVASLRLFLTAPSLAVVRLRSYGLTPNCVETLQAASGWLRGVASVALSATHPDEAALESLLAWLAADSSLAHVRYHHAPR